MSRELFSRAHPGAPHSELVSLAAKWLQKKCAVVVTEIATTGEEPDALGWHGTHSILVECKASRADFLADRQKAFRRQQERGIGQSRYFLAPAGLINVAELPDNWGLLELRDDRVREVKKSGYFEPSNERQETRILLSVLRRLGQQQPTGCSIRFYTFTAKNRATVGVEEPLGVNNPRTPPTAIEPDCRLTAKAIMGDTEGGVRKISK